MGSSRFEIAGATPEQQRELDNIVDKFTISDARLSDIIGSFRQKMKEGLASDGQPLKMIPTFITERPAGNGTGSFYAIDLGGTNLRVLRVNLKGNSEVEIEHQKVCPERKCEDKHAVWLLWLRR